MESGVGDRLDWLGDENSPPSQKCRGRGYDDPDRRLQFYAAPVGTEPNVGHDVRQVPNSLVPQNHAGRETRQQAFRLSGVPSHDLPRVRKHRCNILPHRSFHPRLSRLPRQHDALHGTADAAASLR